MAFYISKSCKLFDCYLCQVNALHSIRLNDTNVNYKKFNLEMFRFSKFTASEVQVHITEIQLIKQQV